MEKLASVSVKKNSEVTDTTKQGVLALHNYMVIMLYLPQMEMNWYIWIRSIIYIYLLSVWTSKHAINWILILQNEITIQPLLFYSTNQKSGIYIYSLSVWTSKHAINWILILQKEITIQPLLFFQQTKSLSINFSVHRQFVFSLFFKKWSNDWKHYRRTCQLQGSNICPC
jgi:hypothetical protein